MKHVIRILNLYIFCDIKERSRGWAINLGDQYQLFDIHHPTHRRRLSLDGEPVIVPSTFISDDEYGRWSLSPGWEPSLSRSS